MLSPLKPIGTLVEGVHSWNPTRDAAGKLIHYIDLSSIDATNKSISVSASISADTAPSRARQLVRRGDVLISTVRPNLNGVARVPSELDGATASTGFCVLRPNPAVLDSAYLFHWVKTPAFVTYLTRRATGASYPAVNDGIIFESTIPLPPLDEQRRVAAILDQADELRRKRRLALEKLNALPQAIFQEMFGNLTANPSDFDETTLGDICAVKGGKRLPKGAAYAEAPTAFRYIRVVDFANGIIDESKLLYLTSEIQRRISRYTVQARDVVISIAGSIGLVAEVPESLSGANLTENAAKLVPRDRQQISSTFLTWLLRSPFCQSQIAASTGQVTIGKLALFRIEKLRIPLPSLEQQKVFERRIVAVQDHLASMARTLTLSDDLFTSLQYHAFAGTLTLSTDEATLASLKRETTYPASPLAV